MKLEAFNCRDLIDRKVLRLAFLPHPSVEWQKPVTQQPFPSLLLNRHLDIQTEPQSCLLCNLSRWSEKRIVARGDGFSALQLSFLTKIWWKILGHISDIALHAVSDVSRTDFHWKKKTSSVPIWSFNALLLPDSQTPGGAIRPKGNERTVALSDCDKELSRFLCVKMASCVSWKKDKSNLFLGQRQPPVFLAKIFTKYVVLFAETRAKQNSGSRPFPLDPFVQNICERVERDYEPWTTILNLPVTSCLFSCHCVLCKCCKTFVYEK